jgi:nitrogen fixation/metabolism regulation signal transduction histidine kinase
VSPFASIAIVLILVYTFSLLLAIRLSRQIVTVIDALSKATLRVGKGDFKARVVVTERNQPGKLAASFTK